VLVINPGNRQAALEWMGLQPPATTGPPVQREPVVLKPPMVESVKCPECGAPVDVMQGREFSAIAKQVCEQRTIIHVSMSPFENVSGELVRITQERDDLAARINNLANQLQCADGPSWRCILTDSVSKALLERR